MKESELINNLEWLRQDIIGHNKLFQTPYGEKPLIYTDYAVSARAVSFIENYILTILNYFLTLDIQRLTSNNDKKN
ncbi:MAG: hypothetical protein HQ534_14040 [Armatimonadetes bacterium]|nr:hypothetical protein [Armatimonadota bacterium]